MSIKCHQFLLSDKWEDPEEIYFLSLFVSTLDFHHITTFSKSSRTIFSIVTLNLPISGHQIYISRLLLFFCSNFSNVL